MDNKQTIQNEQYNYPYHYIPEVNNGVFSQTQHWSWGFRYLGGIQVVLDRLKKMKFNSLIDIGCGDGRFLRELENEYNSKELLGIDYSQRAIAIAQAMNPDISYDEVNILEKSLDDLFDVATAIEVLEHIPIQDLPKFIKSIAKLIRAEGCFILTVPHENTIVAEKHYQHFNSARLKNLLTPYFKEIEFVTFDSRSRVMQMLLYLFGGKGKNYLITNQYLNSWFYKIYIRNYLYVENEQNCMRIAAVCKK